MLPSGEKIVETKQCRLSGQEFFVTDKDIEFYDKISPTFAGKKYLIPTPTLCPEERQKRRLAFRNERNLYRRKCDKTGQDIISVYSPDKPYVVYEQKVWWGDDWSPFDYGADFDFSRPFFDQFHELKKRVPSPNLHVIGNENSDYINQCGYTKDSYMCSNTDYSEKCIYTTNFYKCRDCIDCFMGQENEKCYQAIDSSRCYDCKYVFGCTGCRESIYMRNCISCSNCFGCTNLINKNYCIFNTQHTPESYKEKVSQYLQHLDFTHFIQFLRKTDIVVRPHIINSENCVGENIVNAKNIYLGIDIEDAEDSRYVSIFSHGRDCMDFDIGGYQSELCYELVSSGDKNFNCCFSPNMWSDTSNIFYSDMIKNGNHLFGCTRIMKKSEHCIFNKPYSVTEYEGLCGKLVDHMQSTGEWGEFFPCHTSPFGYNETVGNEYYPMAENTVKERGWNWYVEKMDDSIMAEHFLPLRISQYDEKIVGYETAQTNINTLLSTVIRCPITGKPFKIIKQELIFYIENSLPIPTKHPDQRHKERISLRNPRKFHERVCKECGKNVVTTYGVEKKEKVVCEECYRKLVY